jgi:hydrogenase expression/formation protein HypE
MNKDRILLDHGEGGAATARLIRDLFVRHFGGPPVLEDATIVEGADRVALTTDSFVVQPLFFPGGDIGRLAVCGTVNDLAVAGAEPRFLTAGFVIEEGLERTALENIVASMAGAARESDVRIVSGDTKVVRRGEADSLFINTSGLGIVPDGRILSSASCREGDAVLCSGPVGDHGTAVVVAREDFRIEGDLSSDCSPVTQPVRALLAAAPSTRCMRDPTRGGLATALVEIAEASGVGMRLRESAIPVRRPVRAACDLLGLDPLYMACEGRFVAVVPAAEAEKALGALGRDAARIGEVSSSPTGVVLETSVGGHRPLIALEGAQLPRIC